MKAKNYGRSLIERVAFEQEDAEVAVDQAVADMTGEEPAVEPAASEESDLPPNLSQMIDLLAEVRATVDKNPTMSNADAIRKQIDELVAGVHGLAANVATEARLRSKIGAPLLKEILGKPVPPDPVPDNIGEFGPMYPSISGDTDITDPAQGANEGGVNLASGAQVESLYRPEQDEEEPEEDEEEGEEEEESLRRSTELLKGDRVDVRGVGECRVLAADNTHVLVETSSGTQMVVYRNQARLKGEILGVPADDVSGDEPQDIPDLREKDPEEGEAEEEVVDFGSETDIGPAIN